MQKEKAVDLLIKNGYQASNAGGVVTLSDPVSEEEARKARDLLKNAGYEASFGYRLSGAKK